MADYISREAVLDMAYWHGSKLCFDHLFCALGKAEVAKQWIKR